MINLGLTVTFATLKYPLTQFPLPEEGGEGEGKKATIPAPYFAKTPTTQTEFHGNVVIHSPIKNQFPFHFWERDKPIARDRCNL